MAHPDLTESAWHRARENAARIYPSTEFEVAASLITIVVGAVAAVVSAGSNATTQIAVPVIGGALALAVSFTAVFLAQLIAAPKRQRDELRAAWNPGEPIKPIDIGLVLRNERRKAAGFYRVQNGAMVTTKEDQRGAEEWTNRIVDLLSEHVDADAAREFIEAPRGVQGGLGHQLQAHVGALDRIIARIGNG